MSLPGATASSRRVGRCASLLLAGLALPALTCADHQHFPGSASTAQTLQVQERVEELYSAEDYARALLIYKKQLAPAGDKYAQYMVGYMHLTGRGTDVDRARALAWYRLAAERDERPFVRARDSLQASVDTDELQRADTWFAELLPEYGDRQLLLDLIKDDLAFLRRNQADSTTGLATGFLVGPAIDHAALARERLEKRLDYLSQLPDVPSLADEERELRVTASAILGQ